uniref:SNF2 N-terminal domain-containing protein n=1 Tax=Eptatretus burgeri TaxID=7764 RepID=A0A8C4R7T2_EPTBU
MDDVQDDLQRRRAKESVQKAKEEARIGNLAESLHHLRVAYRISPTEKIKNNIYALEEAVKMNEEVVEGDEFVNILDSGFLLYHELHDKLYPYQREGIVWLYTRHCEQRRGCILADDMGLGKTIQVVSFLSGMYDADKVQSVLIVMPTTLISNWKSEFQMWKCVASSSAQSFRLMLSCLYSIVYSHQFVEVKDWLCVFCEESVSYC